MYQVRKPLVIVFALIGALIGGLTAPAFLDYTYQFVRMVSPKPELLKVEPASPKATQKSPVKTGTPGGEKLEPPENTTGLTKDTPTKADSGEKKSSADPTKNKPKPLAKADGEVRWNDYEPFPSANSPALIGAVALLGLILGGVFGNLLTNFLEFIQHKWDRMAGGDKVNLFLGVFAGLILTVPFMTIFSTLGATQAAIASIGLMVMITALFIYAFNSVGDLLPWQRGKGKFRRTGIKILDTNVIIDGRIYDVMKTGFLEGQLYVPNFVLDEVQYIADSADALRRQRGRRGLEILRMMQSEFSVEVGAQDRLATDQGDGVDARLVRLAKAIGGDLVTNDVNLNRVARLQDVPVLNLNDLALSLKPNVLPSEGLGITIIREGNQPGQGVGYLDDGTMVVVENGKQHMNEMVEVLVTQVIQTERGKLIFAEAHDALPEPHSPESKTRRLPK